MPNNGQILGGFRRGPTAEEALEIVRQAARRDAERARAIQSEEERLRWVQSGEPIDEDRQGEDDPDRCGDW